MSDIRPAVDGKGQPSRANTGTTTHNQLAEGLGTLARDLEQFDDQAGMLAGIVAAAVAMIPGAEEGSISVVIGRRAVTSQAPTSDLPLRIDALQEQSREGPCLDAAYEQQTVRVDDLSSEDRWPRFSPRASAAGAVSMLSIQLYVEGDDLGALNLYAGAANAFTDESEQVGLLFAAHAAIAYVGVRKQTQLNQALISRDLIGQAKGILMERYGITGERAFLLLTRASQNSNQKLQHLAATLVEHGTIPGLPAGDPRR